MTPHPKGGKVKRYEATLDWEGHTLAEMLAMWRFARRFFKQHGFPDWVGMWFSMDLTFVGYVTAEQAEKLREAADDLYLPIGIAEAEQ